jgi:hypothetical protein
VDKNSSANISDTQLSVFHYPDLDVSWEHRVWGTSPIPTRHWTDQWGTRLYGKNGMLTFSSLGYEFVPADGKPHEGFHMLSKTGDLENIDIKAGLPFEETEKRHVLDFMRARETRSRPIADIEEGHISSASCELANIAQELGRTLSYDPKTRTVPGDAEATRRLMRPYRSPWVHPDPTTV